MIFNQTKTYCSVTLTQQFDHSLGHGYADDAVLIEVDVFKPFYVTWDFSLLKYHDSENTHVVLLNLNANPHYSK